MIPFPSSIIPTEAEWGLESNVMTFTSPLTQAAQTLQLPGDRWAFSFSYGALTDVQASQLTAFLVRARGGAGRFKVSNPMRLRPTGAGGGTPVVSGAAQTGTSLVTSGWPVSSTVLRTGDYFECNGELKMMIADAVSNASGVATLTFEPPLRAAPPNSLSIITTNPAATFRLVDSSSKWIYLQGFVSSLAITAVESWL